MSRGLGTLQREVRTIVSDYTDRFYGEYVLERESVTDDPSKTPWLTWAIIRNLYFQEHGLDSSITALISVHSSLERSLKRALKSLVERGEVCRVPSPFGWHYTTPEQFQKYKEHINARTIAPEAKC